MATGAECREGGSSKCGILCHCSWFVFKTIVVGGIVEPSLGPELKGTRIMLWIEMHGVDGDANLGSGRIMRAVEAGGRSSWIVGIKFQQYSRLPRRRLVWELERIAARKSTRIMPLNC